MKSGRKYRGKEGECRKWKRGKKGIKEKDGGKRKELRNG